MPTQTMANNINPQNHWLDATLITSLGAALVYVSGWAFAYEYFDFFNLGLLSLEIPAEYFFVYGFWVVKANGYGLLLLYAIWLGIKYWPNAVIQQYVAYLKPALPVTVLLLFLLFYLLANQFAKDKFKQQQMLDYSSYPAVQIWLKTDPNTPKDLSKLAQKLKQGCYRLLLQNKDKAFVFRPKRNLPGKLAVSSIPQHNISSLRILSRYQSCP